jgi:post-segregation antitoxin (ccd killing protein)
MSTITSDGGSEYERRQAELAHAMKDLEQELAPDAKKYGVNVQQLAQMVLIKQLEPSEFQRLHKEASRIYAESEARLLKLKQVAKQLEEVINDEAKTEDPFRLHRARLVLDEVNALIKKWK